MSESKFKLVNPPIIEAVLDIECVLPPSLKIATLESSARKELGKKYTECRRMFVQEHQFEAKANESAKYSVTGEIRGLQFVSNDQKQIVQFRAEGFSFNRLAPYTSLDDYLPQIKKAWLAYVKLASPVKISLIRLRYINRLLLKLKDGKVNINEYFANGPQLADEENLTLLGFLDQYVALDTITGYQVNSVLTAQSAEGDKLPIIFDNSAIALEEGEPENWTWIRSKILDLRELKNRVFKKTLTKKCLNQYQQP